MFDRMVHTEAHKISINSANYCIERLLAYKNQMKNANVFNVFPSTLDMASMPTGGAEDKTLGPHRCRHRTAYHASARVSQQAEMNHDEGL